MSVAKKEESGKIIQPKKMGLLVENPVYKPLDIHGVMMHG